MPDESAFAPPAAEIVGTGGWRRWGGFLRSRVLRLASAGIIWGLAGTVVRPGPWAMVGGVAFGLMLWAPTTLGLFRVTFFPRAPDPRVTDPDGEAVSPSDQRWIHRIRVVEHALGVVPLVGFAVWALVALPDPLRWGGLIFVPALIASGWQLRRGLQGLVLVEATLDLALGLPRRALRWLSVWYRATGHLPAWGWQVRALAERRLGLTSEMETSLEQLQHWSGIDDFRERLKQEEAP